MNVANLRPKPFAVCSPDSDVSPAAGVNDPVFVRAITFTGAAPPRIINAVFAAGVDPAEPVGLAGLYHWSTVRAVAVLDTITPYTCDAVTTSFPAHAFVDHEGDVDGVTVVAV